MPPRPPFRSLLAYGALLVVLFGASAGAAYVYQHSPARDTVSVRLEAAPPAAGARTIAGTVTAVEEGRLILATDTGPQTLSLPSGTPLDDLLQAADGLVPGTPVNVGVLSTRYGLVLTGVVAIEDAR